MKPCNSTSPTNGSPCTTSFKRQQFSFSSLSSSSSDRHRCRRRRRRWSTLRYKLLSDGLFPTTRLQQLLVGILVASLSWNANRFHCNSLSLRPTLIAGIKPTRITNSAMSLASSLSDSHDNRRKPNQNRHDESTDNSTHNESDNEQPLLSIGMVADIQYAPIPDGTSYSGTPRYYRHSLEATKHAFRVFRDYERPHPHDSQTATGVDLVVNLGDIIDGKCQEIELNGGCLPSPTSPFLPGQTDNIQQQALWKDLVDHPGMLSLLEIQHAMKAYCDNNGIPKNEGARGRTILHSYGNHCLYNLNRTELGERLGIPFRSEGSLQRGFGNFRKLRKEDSSMKKGNNPGIATTAGTGSDDDHEDLVGYYSYVHPAPQDSSESNVNDTQQQHSIKFLVLDSYDIALMRRSPRSSQKRKAAVEILQEHNGKNFREGNENSPEGLEGLQKRFVAFNGAVGPVQLEWLAKELEETRQENKKEGISQKVIVLSHQPIHPDSSSPVCLVWNYHEVLEVLRDYSDVVVASFAGHAHKGGYALDEVSGIHFRVVEAVLESKPPTKTFGILNIYKNRLELKGYGDCESAIYSFQNDDDKETTPTNSGSERKNEYALDPSFSTSQQK